MSANASPRAVRNAVLESKLEDFPEHQLEMDCMSNDCSRGRRYLVGSLARMHPQKTVNDVIRHLRCQGCGQKAASVVLIRVLGLRRPQELRVGLVGDEAND
jgi:hypothetical protein